MPGRKKEGENAMSKKKMMKKMAIIGLAASVSMSNLSSIAAAGIETIPGNVKVLSVNATDTKASISNDEGRSKKAFEVTKAEFQKISDLLVIVNSVQVL